MANFSFPLISVQPTDSLFHCLNVMKSSFVKHIVILDKMVPKGIVTERDISSFLESNQITKALQEIPVNRVMKKNVITIEYSDEDFFMQCAARMRSFKIGSVVVTDFDGNAKGIVTKADIGKDYTTRFSGAYKVKDFMTREIVTCRITDSLEYALRIMNLHKISRIVATDSLGHVAGMLTTNTFLVHSDYFSDSHTRSKDYLLPHNGKDLTVKDMLNDVLLTVGMDDDLSLASSLMSKNKINGIPVVDDGKHVIGIVTATDITNAYYLASSHPTLLAEYEKTY